MREQDIWVGATGVMRDDSWVVWIDSGFFTCTRIFNSFCIDRDIKGVDREPDSTPIHLRAVRRRSRNTAHAAFVDHVVHCLGRQFTRSRDASRLIVCSRNTDFRVQATGGSCHQVNRNRAYCQDRLFSTRRYVLSPQRSGRDWWDQDSSRRTMPRCSASGW